MSKKSDMTCAEIAVLIMAVAKLAKEKNIYTKVLKLLWEQNVIQRT